MSPDALERKDGNGSAGGAVGERWLGRGLAIAAVAAAVIGCAAGSDGPSGTAGQGGGAAGAAGTTGSAGTGSAGTTGAAGTACVMPPVVKMAWTIGRDATGPEITCDQAGASSVQLTMNQTATSFSCAAKTGTSMGLPAGSYTPRVLLSGSQGTLLSQGNLNPVTVPSCGVIDLGRVRFVVAATGAAGTSGAAGGGGAGTSGAAGTTGAGGTTGTAGTTGAAGTGGGTGPCDASPIFAIHSCAAAMACHDGSGSAANFDMKTTGWEKKLVGGLPKAGGASGLGSLCLQAGVPYLKAGSQPATGLFLDKLFKAKPECGAQMPLIPPNLSASEMDCVQRWANGLTK